MTDLRVTLKYGPTQDQHRSQGNACRARMSPDPEGVTLQIRHEREYMSAWLSFEDALAIADAICEAAKKSGAQ
jgi:hypothetical protein